MFAARSTLRTLRLDVPFPRTVSLFCADQRFRHVIWSNPTSAGYIAAVTPGRLIPLLAAAAGLAGCYAYAPIDPVSVAPGASVRARVNGATADQLTPLLGLRMQTLNGAVIATAPDTMIIEVPTAASTPMSGGIVALRQRVSVPRSGLLLLESRTLSRTRTAMAVVGTSVAVGAVIAGAYVLGPGKEKLPGGDGGTDFSIPFLRISW